MRPLAREVALAHKRADQSSGAGGRGSNRREPRGWLGCTGWPEPTSGPHHVCAYLLIFFGCEGYKAGARRGQDV